MEALTSMDRCGLPVLPSGDARWQDWLRYGLAWTELRVHRSARELTARRAAGEALSGQTRTLTMHAYREAQPGARWKALFDAIWPAYRAWWASQGLDARPSLAECRSALTLHMPQLLPTWERLCELTSGDPLAARMLSMWNMPAFAVGCAQAVIPGEAPLLVRNYDYDEALFERVIASTDYSGRRQVIGTSDLLWGLLDGMNSDGLAVSLAYGGRPGSGEGFGIPLVLRYLLETCGNVDEAIATLGRLPIAQSYNIGLADTSGAHASVFVTPGEGAEVSSLQVTTNHRLDTIEHPEIAQRLNSHGRQEVLLQLAERYAGGACDMRGTSGAAATELVAAMLKPPLRNDAFGSGFGTLYTAEYRPADGVAVWHWPDASWERRFDDADDVRTVELPDNS